ncbi:hypothetical protein K474DRAFT_1587422, partial [Panus rudis PR-1116 ss-1]
MEHQCPAEIWTKIFSFACTDGGYTGCSLSRVSRYFRDASLPVKLQTVSLHGERSACLFLNMLRSRPHPPRVKDL